MLALLLLLLLIASVSLAVLWLLLTPGRRRWQRRGSKPRCLVVLGSGGHTAEMLYDLNSIGKGACALDIAFLIAATDKTSAQKAQSFSSSLGFTPKLLWVPRAREVGQSYATSVVSTLRALFVTLLKLWTFAPEVVLMNGPGTCVPVVVASLACGLLGVRLPSLLFSESFARSENLSLTGRILYPLVDIFTVQWEQLIPAFPRAKYAGFKTCPGAAGTLPLLPPMSSVLAQGGPPTAIVSVGTTKFDALIKTIDDPEFFGILKRIGIRKLVVQVGSGSHRPVERQGSGIELEVLDYSHDLPHRMRSAALVVSHAGAGTIMDSLRAGRRLVVVPNEALMDNHQIQLGMALQAHSLLFCFRTQELLVRLHEANLDTLRAFPTGHSPVFGDSVRKLLQLQGYVPGW